MTSSYCKFCEARIVWVSSPSGQNVPLDEEPETRWLIEAEGALKGSPKGRPVQVRRRHACHYPNPNQRAA